MGLVVDGVDSMVSTSTAGLAHDFITHDLLDASGA